MKRFVLFATALLALDAAPSPPNVVEFDLLYTSDIHGYIGSSEATFLNPEFPPILGGGASALTYVKHVREEAASAGRTVILVDAGDLLTGTPLSRRFKGAAVIDWMNDMGYTAGALGNHDFDQGWQNTRKLVEQAHFPILAGNLYSTETGERVPWVTDHVMVDVGGLRVALLGYITESTVHMSFERNVEGLEFKPIHEVVGKDAARMHAMGADLVFAIVHHGLPHPTELVNSYERMLERETHGELPHPGMSALELAHVIDGVDVWIAGHTHQGYGRPWEDPKTHAIVLEPYARGSSLGHVTFKADRKTDQLLGFDTHFDRGALLTLLEEDVWPDEEMAERIGERVAEAEAGLEEVVAETQVRLTSGPPSTSLLGMVVTDAFRHELDADFAIQNTGGLRGDLLPGPITKRDLLTVAPFDNQMVVVRMKGALLRQIMEDKLTGRGSGLHFSGGRIRWNPGAPAGSRISEFIVGGESLDSSRTYRVAMSDYLAEGNSGLGKLRQVPPEDILYSSLIDRDVLESYFRRLAVLRPEPDGRWQSIPGL